MTRKPSRTLRVAALTATMSLLAMMGVVLNPATAQATAAQPPLPTTCGLDVALVLDASGSIGNSAFNQARQASKDFVNVLEGTPSGVGVYTFASSADAGNAKALTSVASGAGATEVRSHIDAITYTNGGSTNWEAGFDQVPTGVYDVIIFVTDGYPNAGGDYVLASDAQKTAGAFVIALGVGANINAAALQSISGPTLGTDYFMIGDYSGLTQALQDIASATCAGTVSIVKETQDSAGNVIDEKAGWTFSTADATPASGQTDSNGALNFAVDFSAGAGTKNVTITETQKTGWALQQQALKNAVCTVGQTSVTVTNVANGFTIPVSNDEVVTCKVVNKQNPPSLSVEQTITPSFVRDYDWTLAKSLAGGEVATKTVPVGSSASFNYVVTATPTAVDSGWQIAGVAKLTNPSAAAVSGTVSYTAPAGVNCSIPSTHPVAAFSFVNVDFTCTSATKPAAGSITSTVAWTGGTDGDTDSFDFDSAVPSITGAQITVSDDLLGTTWSADAADGVFTKDYTLNHTAATLACVPFTNTATLTEQQQPRVAQQAVVTSQQTVTVCGTAKGIGITNAVDGSFERDHDWALTKTVDKTTATVPVGDSSDFEYTITATPTTVDSNFEVTGQATVTNSNTISLTGIDVTVSVPGGTCTVTNGVNLTIAAAGNAVLDYTCSVPGVTATDSVTPVANVTWDGDADPTTSDSADASATVDFTAVVPAETDAEVVVADDLAGTDWTIKAEDGQFTVTYTLQHEATGLTCEPYTNTATISGIQIVPSGLGAASVPGPASQTVTVCGTALDVSLTNQVAGDFDRDHDWTLTKTVNTNNLLVTVGEQGEATYTLTATPSTTDSNFRLTGTTVVSNANTVEVSGVTVTVTVPEGTCVVVDGAGLTIAAGETATLNYTCTLTRTTAADSVTTVATVVWEGDHDPATTESDDESAAADFTAVTPTETDAEVVLTDDLGQLTETLKATDGAQVITYDLVWTPTVAGCVAYPNTASLTDDGVPVTSSAEVTVCAINKPSTLPDTGTPIGMASLLAGLGLGAAMILGSRRRRLS